MCIIIFCYFSLSTQISKLHEITMCLELLSQVLHTSTRELYASKIKVKFLNYPSVKLVMHFKYTFQVCLTIPICIFFHNTSLFLCTFFFNFFSVSFDISHHILLTNGLLVKKERIHFGSPDRLLQSTIRIKNWYWISEDGTGTLSAYDSRNRKQSTLQ